MADFVQTMKDWRRMCKTLGAENCEGCKLHEDGNDCVAVYEGEMDYAKVEKTVTDWAAENPVPVYPTWIEWFQRQVWKKGTDASPMFLYDPIPADIAEKLGIEPMER